MDNKSPRCRHGGVQLVSNCHSPRRHCFERTISPMTIWERCPFNTPQFRQFKKTQHSVLPPNNIPSIFTPISCSWHRESITDMSLTLQELTRGIGQIMAHQIASQLVIQEMTQKIMDNINRRFIPMESFYKYNGYLKFIPEYDKDRPSHAMDAVENCCNEAALVC